MGEDNKKKLIKEKIVGRSFSKGLVFKWILLAAVCGIVFGLCSSYTKSLVSSNRDKAAEEKNGPVIEASETVTESEETVEITETEAETAENEKDAEPENAETEGSAPEDTGEEQLPEESLPSDDIPDDELTETAAEETEPVVLSELLKGEKQELLKNTSEYIVSVKCISRDKTWFDDPVEKTETYAGVIVSVDENEILILSGDIDVKEDNTLQVVFYDGTSNIAVIKERSRTDKIAMIAVPVQGLGEEFMAGISSAPLSTEDPLPGERLIAEGAPLGVIPSVQYGYSGYVETAAALDSQMSVIYADIPANVEKGTFIMNDKGELAGIAIERNEAENDEIEKDITAFRSIASMKDIIKALLKGQTGIILGLKGVDVSFDMKYNSVPEGMYVTDIKMASPAYNVGVKRGDILTKVNGMEVKSVKDYLDAIRFAAPDELVKLTVERAVAAGEYRELEFSCSAKKR